MHTACVLTSLPVLVAPPRPSFVDTEEFQPGGFKGRGEVFVGMEFELPVRLSPYQSLPLYNVHAWRGLQVPLVGLPEVKSAARIPAHAPSVRFSAQHSPLSCALRLTHRVC